MDKKFGNGLVVGLIVGVICGSSFGQVLENNIRQIACNAINSRFMGAFLAGVLGGAIVGWLSMKYSNKQQKDNIENN